MTELLDLRAQVAAVEGVLADVQRNPLDDLEPETGQRRHLTRVVGKQAQSLDTEVDKDLRADTVVAQVCAEAEALVGLDRIGAGVLQGVRL